MDITEQIRTERKIGTQEKILLALRLSGPAILAQTASIVMQYIDAAMVGSLGADASASVGLVASTTWLFGGLMTAAAYGFSVQIAQAVGAGNTRLSRAAFRTGCFFVLAFSAVLAAAAALLSGPLPAILGAGESIRENASAYFLIFACSIPCIEFRRYAGASLQSCGNMRLPGALNALMCLLDVVYNYFFIHPGRRVSLMGTAVFVPGFGWGVAGAAMGTALAELTVAVLMLLACRRQRELTADRASSRDKEKALPILRKACRIGAPIALEQTALCGAMVVSTHIVAPLGSAAIAANSFAVTAESVCYMPGFGLQQAATTLVGQCYGGGRRDLAKNYAWISVRLSMGIMSAAAVVMFAACPAVFAFLTPDPAVRALAAKILRLELAAEPFYGASIVASGSMRGAGDTFVPGLMTLVSIWGVRLSLSAVLVGPYGLTGVWAAMLIELVFRGVIFLTRMRFGKWMK